jgi:GMP synthase (glutamine-hydrolysing)
MQHLDIGDPQVLIIELGSQYTLLIGRTLRELGVRSIILEPKRAEAWLKLHTPRAIILSGSDASVYDTNAPRPPELVLTAQRDDGSLTPVLGICYGMQWMANASGGRVESVEKHRAYGPDTIERTAHLDDLLLGLTPTRQQVWMSHGDTVTIPPPGFSVLAKSQSGAAAVIGNGTHFGVQFHPEVIETQHGKQILENFLFKIAECDRDWEPKSLVDSIYTDVMSAMGPDDKAIFGLSGGVDSSTLAAVLAPVLGDRLLAVTIDGGQFREGELDEIREHACLIGVQLCIIDARDEFAAALADVTDAEEKRGRFRTLYSKLLQKTGREFGAQWLVQGTLAPDKIESGATGGAVIKTHHNVNLDTGLLKQLHPFDHLFKYEVRDLARALGLPERICEREPFPGPGLFLRILGAPVTPELLEVVCWADARVREILMRHDALRHMSQLVVAYMTTPTVGVKGDARVYRGSVIIRAVHTLDFMTAIGIRFPDEPWREIEQTLAQHPLIVRVWEDSMPKPPATTEFE